jgi:hypothetical protein
MKKTFSPQALRAILLVLLIAAISGGAGLFYTEFSDVRDFAAEVNSTVATADASGVNLQKLQSLKSELAQNQTFTTKVNQLFVSPATYQSQATMDINNYAAAAGIRINPLTFEQNATDVYPVINVSLRNPVSYSKLIHFLDNIEGNVPKMQVTNIAISHVRNGTADSVTVDTLKIMIATR